MTYPTGAVKRDPESLAVAIRTTAADEQRAWAVMTVDRGGHYAETSEVESWPDLG